VTAFISIMEPPVRPDTNCSFSSLSSILFAADSITPSKSMVEEGIDVACQQREGTAKICRTRQLG
jgi:hypothetical protein